MDNLRDIAGSVATIKVGETEYALAPLTLKDFGDAERFIIDERLSAQAMLVAKGIPLSDAVQAQALAAIQAQPVNWLTDVIGTSKGRLKLIELSMRRGAGGKQVPKMDDIANKSAITPQQLMDILFSITGLSVPEDKENQSPFPGTV